MAVILYLLVLSGWMMNHLVDFLVVVLLDERRMPFNRDVHLLKEIIDYFMARRQYTTTAHLHPVTLRTCVARAVHYFQHEGLEGGFFFVHQRVQLVLPVGLFPPTVPFVMVN